MVQIANSLSLVGDKITDRELALFDLGCLGTKFDLLVTTFTARLGSGALLDDEMQGLLMNHEIRLSKNMVQSLENSFSVNYASKPRYNANSHNSFQSNRCSLSMQK